MSVTIQIEALRKRYGQHTALFDVTCTVGAGQLAAVVGPSGCGKSTLLRLLAGFEHPDHGTITFNNAPVQHLPPERRPTALMFQHYALWPHLTVFEHLAYGLRVRRWPREQIRQRVAALLDLVGLRGLEQRYPGQLSGGQQQRVALARALAIEPGVLLLDEPLSNLDAEVRAELRAELRALQQRLGTTTIYVTHDQEEALSIADQLIVLQAGHVAQADVPAVIYRRPATPFVARFVGMSSLLPGRITNVSVATLTLGTVSGGEEHFVVPRGVWRGAVDPQLGQPVTLAVKPEHVRRVVPGTTQEPWITGKVRQINFLGGVYRLWLSTNWGDLVMAIGADVWEPAPLLIGDHIPVALEPGQIHLFPDGTERSGQTSCDRPPSVEQSRNSSTAS